MFKFLFIRTVFILITLVGLFYLLTRFYLFWKRSGLTKGSKPVNMLLAAVPVAGLIALAVYKPITGIIVIIHFALFLLILDIAGWIYRKLSHKKCKFYPEPLIALCITAVYLFIGWHSARNVVQTNYTLTTTKNIGAESLKIAHIADSHLGATFGGDGFAEHIAAIQAENPDMVVITGDFVDDDTKKEDMLKTCDALGRLQTKYGVFFVYGNHDKGHFDYRDFNDADLREALTVNGIKILEDETVSINENVYITGRQDASEPSRKSAEDLSKALDKSKYLILLDHQPNDFDNEAKAGFDLVLSGHTHGGQIFPLGFIAEALKVYNKAYGLKTVDNTNFIVSSGISDWAAFKIGVVAEYGIIDITQSEN